MNPQTTIIVALQTVLKIKIQYCMSVLFRCLLWAISSKIETMVKAMYILPLTT